MLDFPVMVLIEKPEDLSEILRLPLSLEVDMVEDVVLCPLDLIIIVQIVCLKKFLLDLLPVQVFEVVWVGSSLDVSFAALYHAHH